MRQIKKKSLDILIISKQRAKVSGKLWTMTVIIVIENRKKQFLMTVL